VRPQHCFLPLSPFSDSLSPDGGRGTRIDEASGKLMFRIFDYTGASALFGEDFVTPPPPTGGDEPPPPGRRHPPIKVRGVKIEIEHAATSTCSV